MLSVPHLIIIFLVALIVFGPEKLPELARTFGRALSEFRRATSDLRANFEEQMRELDREASIREAQKGAAVTQHYSAAPGEEAEPDAESAVSSAPEPPPTAAAREAAPQLSAPHSAPTALEETVPKTVPDKAKEDGHL